MKRAIFNGSFDPFTLGHLSIVRRAIESYDQLIINVGNNPEKKCLFNTNLRLEMIKQTLIEQGIEKQVKLTAENILTADLALKENVSTLIRGIRLGTNDPEAEQNLATFNQYLGKIRGIDLQTHRAIGLFQLKTKLHGLTRFLRALLLRHGMVVRIIGCTMHLQPH